MIRVFIIITALLYCNSAATAAEMLPEPPVSASAGPSASLFSAHAETQPATIANLKAYAEAQADDRKLWVEMLYDTGNAEANHFLEADLKDDLNLTLVQGRTVAEKTLVLRMYYIRYYAASYHFWKTSIYILSDIIVKMDKSPGKVQENIKFLLRSILHSSGVAITAVNESYAATLGTLFPVEKPDGSRDYFVDVSKLSPKTVLEIISRSKSLSQDCCADTFRLLQDKSLREQLCNISTTIKRNVTDYLDTVTFFNMVCGTQGIRNYLTPQIIANLKISENQTRMGKEIRKDSIDFASFIGSSPDFADFTGIAKIAEGESFKPLEIHLAKGFSVWTDRIVPALDAKISAFCVERIRICNARAKSCRPRAEEAAIPPSAPVGAAAAAAAPSPGVKPAAPKSEPAAAAAPPARAKPAAPKIREPLDTMVAYLNRTVSVQTHGDLTRFIACIGGIMDDSGGRGSKTIFCHIPDLERKDRSGLFVIDLHAYQGTGTPLSYFVLKSLKANFMRLGYGDLATGKLVLEKMVAARNLSKRPVR